jgi:hypothetical protein
MATLTVRNLDAALVRRLRIRAAENGRSAEAEHREILRTTLPDDEQPHIPRQRGPSFAPPERNRSPTPEELREDARLWPKP